MQGAMLEESMQQLSRTFLIPLEQYVARLMPLKSAISPFKVGRGTHTKKCGAVFVFQKLAHKLTS